MVELEVASSGTGTPCLPTTIALRGCGFMFSYTCLVSKKALAGFAAALRHCLDTHEGGAELVDEREQVALSIIATRARRGKMIVGGRNELLSSREAPLLAGAQLQDGVPWALVAAVFQGLEADPAAVDRFCRHLSRSVDRFRT